MTFPFGVFEDANTLGGAAGFRRLILDCQAHGLNSVILNNQRAANAATLLAVSDEFGFDVYFGPLYDLARIWKPADIPATIEQARAVARQLITTIGEHPSLKGYYLWDEPTNGTEAKLRLLTQAFREQTSRAVWPILVGLGRADYLFERTRPTHFVANIYPVGAENPVGDFTLTGFGYSNEDFVSYLRRITGKQGTTPLWLVLQTHKFKEPGQRFALREPTPAEVRKQHWLSLAEGASGIFWFIYGSQQGWRGLKDNPALFAEVANQARRTAPLASLLAGRSRVADSRFSASTSSIHLTELRRGSDAVLVAVNTDCIRTQSFTVRETTSVPSRFSFWDWLFGGRSRSETKTVAVREVERGQLIPAGQAVTLAPGTGAVYRAE